MTSAFPVPHTDSANSTIDLNEILNIKTNSCFLFRVANDTMNEVGIFKDDIVVVDKSIPSKHDHVILVVIDGEFCIRRLYKRSGLVQILQGNGVPVELPDGLEVTVWGVVTACLRRFV
jgi:DNA polymerase V